MCLYFCLLYRISFFKDNDGFLKSGLESVVSSNISSFLLGIHYFHIFYFHVEHFFNLLCKLALICILGNLKHILIKTIKQPCFLAYIKTSYNALLNRNKGT